MEKSKFDNLHEILSAVTISYISYRFYKWLDVDFNGDIILVILAFVFGMIFGVVIGSPVRLAVKIVMHTALFLISAGKK